MRKKEFSWVGLRVSVYENAVWGTCIVYRGSKSNTPTKHFAARINIERKNVRAGKDHTHTHTHTHIQSSRAYTLQSYHAMTSRKGGSAAAENTAFKQCRGASPCPPTMPVSRALSAPASIALPRT